MSGAMVFINLALVLYTAGVWSEKIQGELNRRHLLIFWLGIICDWLGTAAMGEIARAAAGEVPHAGAYLPFHTNFHSLTGFFALALMVVHAGWATFVLLGGRQNARRNFHRYSLMVWLVWLIPFVSGMLLHSL